MTKVRKSDEEWKIPHQEFVKRFRNRFLDPFFDSKKETVEELSEIAWKAYEEGRKAPRTTKAGREFEDPEYELSSEWLKAREDVKTAQKEYENSQGPSRVLLVVASDRNDQTCPGEVSKSYRLSLLAEKTLREEGMEVEILNLSKMTSEYGKMIYPCKGCVSTAMPLCHWPCSCYPNHSLGQVNDWMNDIYPMWVRAHGIMIITPVYWHQAPSVLKLMIDRLVCADGGNPDPTSTQGKDPKLAKKLELKGWDYPRHLEGRIYSLVVHGDTVGVDDLRNALSSWLNEIMLIPAGVFGTVARYIGYYGPYAESHDELEEDTAIQEEVKNCARALASNVRANREKKLESQIPHLEDPRPK
jgi:multimeric flavodoxin WrbA